ncbi:TPA: exotoxin [Staphylococcus pseudintermedius]|nr:exotoxin [Staphylococcus pseudintermedius]
MKKRKIPLILILSFIVIFIITPCVNGAEKSEITKEGSLHKKSDLPGVTLNNLRQIYFYNEKINSENKSTEDQFLDYTLLFNDFFIDHPWYNDLLVQFISKEDASKYKGKKIDLYGSHYGYSCFGGKPHKTACMYGGVTLHDNNKLDEEKKIPVNLWLDGKQTSVPLDTVRTYKKEVTVQELDLKARHYLHEKYNLYNPDAFGGKIQRGLIVFETSRKHSASYDLYAAEGKGADTILRIYQDNKTISSENIHIDIYLYTN